MMRFVRRRGSSRRIGLAVAVGAAIAVWAAWQCAPRTWGVSPSAVACVLKAQGDGTVYEWRAPGGGRALLTRSRDGRWIRGVAFSSPAADGVPPIPLAWGPSARERFDTGVNVFVAEVGEQWRSRTPDETHEIVFRTGLAWGDEVAGLMTAADRQSRYESPAPTVPPTSDCTRWHRSPEVRAVDWDRLPGRIARRGSAPKVRSVKVGGALVAWDGRGVAASALPCGTSRWPKGFAQLLTAQGWGARELKPLANGTTAGSARPYSTITAVGVTPTSEVVTLRGPGRLPPSTLPADERLGNTIPDAWAAWSHWDLVSAVAANGGARCEAGRR